MGALRCATKYSTLAVPGPYFTHACRLVISLPCVPRTTRKNGDRLRVDSTILDILEFIFLRQPPKPTSNSTCQICMSLVR